MNSRAIREASAPAFFLPAKAMNQANLKVRIAAFSGNGRF